jgi:hypothetical protein
MSIQIIQRLARALQLQILRQEILAGGLPNGNGSTVGARPLPAAPLASPGRGVDATPLRRKPPAKFFTALAMSGRLHLVDIAEGSPWDPMRIKFDSQAMAEDLRTHLGARKVRSIAELDLFLKESAVRAGIIILCVSAELLEAARIRWTYGDTVAASAAARRAPLVG